MIRVIIKTNLMGVAVMDSDADVCEIAEREILRFIEEAESGGSSDAVDLRNIVETMVADLEDMAKRLQAKDLELKEMASTLRSRDADMRARALALRKETDERAKMYKESSDALKRILERQQVRVAELEKEVINLKKVTRYTEPCLA